MPILIFLSLIALAAGDCFEVDTAIETGGVMYVAYIPDGRYKFTPRLDVTDGAALLSCRMWNGSRSEFPSIQFSSVNASFISNGDCDMYVSSYNSDIYAKGYICYDKYDETAPEFRGFVIAGSVIAAAIIVAIVAFLTINRAYCCKRESSIM